MNALLVGGCADGRRVAIPDGVMRYQVANLHRPLAIEIHVYNLFRVHPVTRAVVFAYEKLTPTDIMESLIEGYHPEKQQ